MPYRPLAVVCALAAALALAVPAYAFDCTVVHKPATAGAAFVFENDQPTALKPNPGTLDKPHGAFFAFREGEISGSTFAHAPGGVLPPVREGGPQHNCDGKGLDSLDACGFGE